MGRSVAIVTLGCARNDVDSDQLSALLAAGGYDLVADASDSDVVIVNTCTFIDAATQESVDTVLDACDLKQDRAQAVVVVGCMAERYRDELATALPEADAVVGFGGYTHLPSILDALLRGEQVEGFVGEAPAAPAPRRLPLAGGPPTDDVGGQRGPVPASGPRFPARSDPSRPWSYLKIAGGCDRRCTFCAIPSWRGGFRSRPLDELVDEASWLAGRGVRELVLVSENTTSWGKDLPSGRAAQPELLAALASVDGIERIRLMYLQPDELRPELIEAMVGIETVAPYFDLSLQHASATVLARMARSGGRERFTELIGEIRAREPDAVFRSNFIVGFPGETQDDYEELATFLADARLDWVGLFAFSPQDGTPAASLEHDIATVTVEGRLRELRDLQEEVADDRARGFVGRRLDVIVDDADGSARSYREAPETDGEIRLVVRSGIGHEPARLPAGRVTTAEVIAAEGVDLVAVPELPVAAAETA